MSATVGVTQLEAARNARASDAVEPSVSAPDAAVEAEASERPFFSVIVPVYEHWNVVPGLLAHLAAQTLDPSAYEILLIDNGSTNFVPPPKLPTNARISQCWQPGSYAARNHGIEMARGKWLVFTDADCRPRPEWLAALMESAHRSGPPRLLAGAVEMTSERAQPSVYEIYDLVRGIPQAWYVSRGYAATANLAVPAALARRLRFDGQRYSGGDADFCRRATADGAALHYVPKAAVAHPARTSWPQLACKVRRIKGGQITAGSGLRRIQYGLRTFLPPVNAVRRFMAQRDLPLSYRTVAVAIQLRLWGVEMREAVRMFGPSSAERR